MTTPAQPTQLTQEDLQNIIMSALAAQKADHDAEVAKLLADAESRQAGMQSQLTALQASLSGNVPVLIPEHAAGPGLDSRPTWSKFEQERAYAAAEQARAAA